MNKIETVVDIILSGFKSFIIIACILFTVLTTIDLFINFGVLIPLNKDNIYILLFIIVGEVIFSVVVSFVCAFFIMGIMFIKRWIFDKEL